MSILHLLSCSLAFFWCLLTSRFLFCSCFVLFCFVLFVWWGELILEVLVSGYIWVRRTGKARSHLTINHLAGESMKSTFCCEYPCQGVHLWLRIPWLSAVIYQYLIVSLLFPTIILTVFHTNMYKWLPHIFPLK